MKYTSEKIISGFTACFRQYKAESHCNQSGWDDRAAGLPSGAFDGNSTRCQPVSATKPGNFSGTGA